MLLNVWTIIKKNWNWCLQLWYPYYRLREEGFETFTIGPEQGKTYNSKHGYPCKAEVGIDDVNHEVLFIKFDTAFSSSKNCKHFNNNQVVSLKLKCHNITNKAKVHHYQIFHCIPKVITCICKVVHCIRYQRQFVILILLWQPTRKKNPPILKNK